LGVFGFFESPDSSNRQGYYQPVLRGLVGLQVAPSRSIDLVVLPGK